MNIDRLKKETERAMRIENQLKIEEAKKKTREIYSKLSEKSLRIIIAYFDNEEDPIPETELTDKGISTIPVYGSMTLEDLRKIT